MDAVAGNSACAVREAAVHNKSTNHRVCDSTCTSMQQAKRLKVSNNKLSAGVRSLFKWPYRYFISFELITHKHANTHTHNFPRDSSTMPAGYHWPYCRHWGGSDWCWNKICDSVNGAQSLAAAKRGAVVSLSLFHTVNAEMPCSSYIRKSGCRNVNKAKVICRLADKSTVC